VSAEVVLPAQMALMIPAMVAVMFYRLDDYTGHRFTPQIRQA
jgi:hypothetical protein